MRPKTWKSLVRDEAGQDILEYALIAGIIGVLAAVALRRLSNTYIAVPDLLLNKYLSAF